VAAYPTKGPDQLLAIVPSEVSDYVRNRQLLLIRTGDSRMRCLARTHGCRSLSE
jgi:hypothetical protein